jgi:hypothetical protein
VLSPTRELARAARWPAVPNLPPTPSPQLPNLAGEYENRDKSADKQCTCRATEDFNVNVRNQALRSVLQDGNYPHVHVLPFYQVPRAWSAC